MKERSVFVYLLIVLLIGVFFTGCQEKSFKNTKSDGIVNIALNKMNLATKIFFNGYILENEIYNDNPPTWEGQVALDTYGLNYNSTEKGGNDSIYVFLVRLNSSQEAQDDLYRFVPYGPVTSGLSPIYTNTFEQIGDESILLGYFGKGLFSYDEMFNKTSIVMFFRLKNIACMVEKDIANVEMNEIEFMRSQFYQDYCCEVWEYSKTVEGKILSYVQYNNKEAPTSKLLKLNYLKNELTEKTVTMSLKEFYEDTDYSAFPNGIFFKSLASGDILIIKDNISNIQYYDSINCTDLYFHWEDEHSNITRTMLFQGDLTKDFNISDEVQIKFNVIEINLTCLGKNYGSEIIEDSWTNVSDYAQTHGLLTGITNNFLPINYFYFIIPQNYISKIKV